MMAMNMGRVFSQRRDGFKDVRDGRGRAEAGRRARRSEGSRLGDCGRIEEEGGIDVVVVGAYRVVVVVVMDRWGAVVLVPAGRRRRRRGKVGVWCVDFAWARRFAYIGIRGGGMTGLSVSSFGVWRDMLNVCMVEKTISTKIAASCRLV